jgi:hypothetical protein
MIAAKLTGGTIDAVVLFSLEPHVRIGGTSTHGGQLIRALSGSACTILLSFVFLLTGPRRSAPVQLAREIAIGFAYIELIGWSLSSLLHQHSGSPDDAERFIAASGANPLAIVAACAALGCAGLAFSFVRHRRKIATLGATPAGTIGKRGRSACAGTY